MIYDLNEIAMLPDTFSLEDLRVVCHISKRTARYYLRAGLIPCEISEKKTHCYTIRKEDLLDALKEYQKQPCKFAIPKALNDEKRQRQEALKNDGGTADTIHQLSARKGSQIHHTQKILSKEVGELS